MALKSKGVAILKPLAGQLVQFIYIYIFHNYIFATKFIPIYGRGLFLLFWL